MVMVHGVIAVKVQQHTSEKEILSINAINSQVQVSKPVMDAVRGSIQEDHLGTLEGRILDLA